MSDASTPPTLKKLQMLSAPIARLKRRMARRPQNLVMEISQSPVGSPQSGNLFVAPDISEQAKRSYGGRLIQPNDEQ
jgi:hypothetical protein